MTTYLDVRRELGAERWDWSVVLTYNFDLRFFENHVLPNLNSKRVVVLVDHDQYVASTEAIESRTAPRHVGRSYSLLPVQVTGSFHPKAILSFRKDRAQALVGSGNLTHGGFQGNLELFTAFMLDGKDRSAVQCVATLGHIVSRLCKERTPHELVGEELVKALNESLWITQVSKPAAMSLIHSLNEPLLHQVKAKWGKSRVQEITLFAPFFSAASTVLKFCVETFAPKTLQFCLQEGEHDLTPQAIPPGVSVEFNRLRFPQDAGRMLHAKCLALRGSDRELVLLGSPNITEAALLRTARNGNFEIGLLVDSSKGFVDDTLLKRPMVQMEQVRNLKEIPARINGLSESPRKVQPLLRLLSAEYRSESQLVDLVYEGKSGMESLKVRVSASHPDIDTAQLSVGRSSPGKAQAAVSAGFSGKPFMVRVEIRTQGEWLASDWRWVNDVDFQQSEGTSYFGIPAPTLRAFVEQGREHGVLNALRAIYEESPNALIHFLKQFDLSYFYRQVEAQAPIVVLPGVATAPLAEDEEKGEAPQDFTVPNLGLLKAHPFAELARWARRRLKRVLSHFDPLSPEFDVRRFWNAALESNDILVWMYHKGIGDAFDEGNETIAQTLHENLGGFLDGLPKSKPPLSGLGVRAPDLKRGALAHFTCMVMLAEYVLESTEYLIQVDPEDREDFDRNQFLLLDKASRVISGHAWPGISKVTELKPEMDRLKRSFGLELRMKGVAAFGSYLQELAKYGEGGGPPRAKVFVCPACDRSQTFKRRDRCRICLSQFCQDCARSCENCSPRKELTAIRSQLDR